MITASFNLIQINGKPTKGELLISPLNAPFGYSGSIVGSQTIVLNDNNATVTTALVPSAYVARLTGYNAETSFQFDLSNVTDGSSVDACTYLTNYTGSASSTASYALYSGTSSYSLHSNYPDITDDTSSNFVGINQTNPQYTLDVNGSIGNGGSNNYFIYDGHEPDYDEFGATYFGIDGSPVGIGINEPEFTLEANGTIASNGVIGSIIGIGGTGVAPNSMSFLIPGDTGGFLGIYNQGGSYFNLGAFADDGSGTGTGLMLSRINMGSDGTCGLWGNGNTNITVGNINSGANSYIGVTDSNGVRIGDAGGEALVVLNNQVGINFSGGNPGYVLDVNGDINTSTQYRIGGSIFSPTTIATGTYTFTNKRVTQRVYTTTLASSYSFSTNNYDAAEFLIQATTNITGLTVTGTPVVGDRFRIALMASGTPTMAWGSSFESSGTYTLPTSISSTRKDISFVWNTVTSKWRCIQIA
jgi:hypothetical protein